ncbi:hypothetical protein AB6A40_004207 [Gnathostoma spinigerum]|uniref:Ankyrin repeat and sterile alpha motif domain-containing protein 1B n=1 Tax=Gnathostoma spinigerum TaxID=75299 RepID=A0ABD6EBU2_9BILA
MGIKELNSTQQELFDATRRGDVDKVHHWLANKKNKRPRTPLNFLRPVTPQAPWLCSLVDPSNGYTVLHVAALQGHLGLVKMFIEMDHRMVSARDRRGCLPVHLAAWNGHADVVQLLLDVEPSTIDAVNNAKESPLHLSAQHGHGKVVTVLLSKHANARLRNARCETALDIAARSSRANVCRLIICNCPELALQSAADYVMSGSGRSQHSQVVYPLHIAARHGSVDCLKILCQSGFDLDYVTEEGSALHVAALFGKVEAVRLLLEEGISVDIRDSQGRTVLETLEEHENEKASDLTQVIQSREGWSECRNLIENHIAKMSRNSDNQENTADVNPCQLSLYQNVPESYSQQNGTNDAVWKPITEVRANSGFHDELLSNDRSFAVSTDGIYQPPSIVADVVNLSDLGAFDEDSTLSLSTTLPDPSEPESNHSASPPAAAFTPNHSLSPILRPALISSSRDRRSSAGRVNALVPRMGISNLGTGIRSLCTYQAASNYDAWSPNVSRSYDNVMPPVHPFLAYDNVPKTLLAYDNCPPPGHRHWQHACTSRSPVFVCSGNQFCNTKDCYKRYHSSAQGNDRLANLSATSPQMSTAKDDCCAFSEVCQSFAEANDRDLACGRAPLAIPEEMFGSTSTSIVSISDSPERSILSDTCNRGCENIDTGSLSDGLSSFGHVSDRASSSTLLLSISTQKVGLNEGDHLRSAILDDSGSPVSFSECSSIANDYKDLPSPETSESRIHNILCAHTDLQKSPRLVSMSSKAKENKPDSLSPVATVSDNSDFTLASSCSLPAISQLSSTSPSSHSARERSDKVCDKSLASPVADSCSVHNSYCRTASSYEDYPGENHTSTARENCDSENLPTIKSSDSEVHPVTLAETNEWNQINEILESFRGSVSDGTVSTHHKKPKVAVYLKDRRSQALTLQLHSSSSNQVKVPENFRACVVPKSPSVNAVCDWLNVDVGIPMPRASELAAVLEANGFDDTVYMTVLDRIVMDEIGLDKSTQHQIRTYIEAHPVDFIPDAGNFTYVSDWLHAMNLEDYLGCFMKRGLTRMLIVSAMDPDSQHLTNMGITLLGHQKRILNSLKTAKTKRQQKGVVVDRNSGRGSALECACDSRDPQSLLSRQLKDGSMLPHSSDREWKHCPSALISGCISYSAHYLGSMEISNVEGTEDSRRAMMKMKKDIREIAKVPQVFLQISVEGVRVLDASSKELAVEHDITRIQIVCQDERDLNCFAYISQDGDKHFCHVFCVLTADVATEIIVTLGQAFEICYRIANGTYGNKNTFSTNRMKKLSV